MQPFKAALEMTRPPFLLTIALVITASVLTASVCIAENWPGWRGPRGDGSSTETSVPVRWNGETGENVRWKTSIPGEGHASPIIWHDRVFLVTCIDESLSRNLICLDRIRGKTIWTRTVLKAELEKMHALNSRASSTPATDGELVFVAFLEIGDDEVVAPNVGSERIINTGTMVVAAYDFDGNQKWLVRPGPFLSAHGFCTCPVIFKDLVILNGDHDGDSYVVALDKKTGEERWRTSRRHKTRSYVTPLVRDVDGRTQMVLSGSKCIVSLDPHDGSRLWEVDGPTEQFVASMVYDGDLFFMAAGFPDYFVTALRPDGNGDVTDSHVAWESRAAKCYVPSPVVLNGYLMVADDRGTANCFDAKTGDAWWKERLGNHFSASLIHANGFVYFLADNGVAKVVRPGRTLDVVAENPLGENVYSSPAISSGQLFLRGEHHLYCIESASGVGR